MMFLKEILLFVLFIVSLKPYSVTFLRNIVLSHYIFIVHGSRYKFLTRVVLAQAIIVVQDF